MTVSLLQKMKHSYSNLNLLIIFTSIYLSKCQPPPPPPVYSPIPLIMRSNSKHKSTELNIKGVWIPEDIGFNFQILKPITNNIYLGTQFLCITNGDKNYDRSGIGKRKYLEIASGYNWTNSLLNLNLGIGFGVGRAKISYTTFDKNILNLSDLKDNISGLYFQPFLQTALGLKYNNIELGLAWRSLYFRFKGNILQDSNKHLKDVFNDNIYYFSFGDEYSFNLQLINSLPVYNTFGGKFYEGYNLNLGLSFAIP